MAALGNQREKISPEVLHSCFIATSGLVRSQIIEIAGVEAPTIQNWIKRGWVPNPVQKKYTINHLARILIIKMLRDVLQLEKIAAVLTYVNGDANDLSDNIVSEFELYSYIYQIISYTEQSSQFSLPVLEEYIEKCTADYAEAFAGARAKLQAALKAVMLAFTAAKLKRQADEMIQTF